MPLWVVVVACIVAYHFGHVEGVNAGLAATGNTRPVANAALASLGMLAPGQPSTDNMVIR